MGSSQKVGSKDMSPKKYLLNKLPRNFKFSLETKFEFFLIKKCAINVQYLLVK